MRIIETMDGRLKIPLQGNIFFRPGINKYYESQLLYTQISTSLDCKVLRCLLNFVIFLFSITALSFCSN